MNNAYDEIDSGDRFAFGDNWKRFLDNVDDRVLDDAIGALKVMLRRESLEGLTFCDVGSGSGLHSVAAATLGATVTAFDYDPQSVACTRELARRFDVAVAVTEGSALDPEFLRSLGQFDVVYSWGVLHHTGDMWRALELVIDLVAPDGSLFLALYNDAGGVSRRWANVKRLYNRSPAPVRALLLAGAATRLWWFGWLRDTLRGNPLKSWRSYGVGDRGMSAWTDMVDWVGGWPYEVAAAGDVVDLYLGRGFELTNLRIHRNPLGCNQYVFRRRV